MKGVRVGVPVVLVGAGGLLDVEFLNGAMELVRVAFLEKIVKVEITRGFPVASFVGVEGSLVEVDIGGTVGVDVGTVGVKVGTVGMEADTGRIDVGTVRGEVDTVIVMPAVSQRPSAALTMSGVRSDRSTTELRIRHTLEFLRTAFIFDDWEE